MLLLLQPVGLIPANNVVPEPHGSQNLVTVGVLGLANFAPQYWTAAAWQLSAPSKLLELPLQPPCAHGQGTRGGG